MTVSENAASGSRGKPRGGPLRIDRAAIVDAARSLEPAAMTMQAVADELGVDRKALNYHVTNREGLLKLVAAEVFEEAFADVDIAAETGWRDALVVWAEGVRRGMVATGALANYYRINSQNLQVLRPAETILNAMAVAGFSAETAGRALIFVTNFSMTAGRDLVLASLPGGHPQGPELRRAFEENADVTGYDALRNLAASGLNTAADSDSQFDFEVRLFLNALQQELDEVRTARASGCARG